MEKAFNALQKLTKEWQQALNWLLCTSHQLLAFAAVEHMMSAESRSEEEMLDVWLAAVFKQPPLRWLECCWTAVSDAMLHFALFDMTGSIEALVLGQMCFVMLAANREPAASSTVCRALQDVQANLSTSTLQAFFTSALLQSCGMSMAGQAPAIQLAECVAAQPDMLKQHPGAIPLCMSETLGPNALKFVSAMLPLLNQSSAMPAAAAMLAHSYTLDRRQTAAMQDFTSTIAKLPADVSFAAAFAAIFGGTRFMTLSQPLMDLASDLTADTENASFGETVTRVLLAIASAQEHHAAGSLVVSAAANMSDATWQTCSKRSLADLYQSHLAASLQSSCHQHWEAIISMANQPEDDAANLVDLEHILKLAEYLSFGADPSSLDQACRVVACVLQLSSGAAAPVGKQCWQIMTACTSVFSAVQSACGMTQALLLVTDSADTAPILHQLCLIERVLKKQTSTAQIDINQIDAAELMHGFAAEHQQQALACLEQASRAAANLQSAKMLQPLMTMCCLELADTRAQKLREAATCLAAVCQDTEVGRLSPSQTMQKALDFAAICNGLPTSPSGQDGLAAKLATVHKLADSLTKLRHNVLNPKRRCLLLQSAADVAQACGCSNAQKAFEGLIHATTHPSAGQPTVLLQLCQVNTRHRRYASFTCLC